MIGSGPVYAALVLTFAVLVDVSLGEPPARLHPVVWMGALQAALRRRAPRRPWAAFAWGLGMALAGPLVFGGGALLVERALQPWPLLRLVVDVWLLKSAFAARALGDAAERVAFALRLADADAAREALRSLVSRDTRRLSPPLLAAAAIESVAENSSDSIVAPLCAWALFGVPGALAYRAANTLDAMIGYRGETEWLGKAAARLDDALNLVPARLTALFIAVAAAFTGESPAGALRVWRADGGKTESPNAGRPMAAMAGALGVELEKVGCYRLGAGGGVPGAAHVDRAVRVMTGAAVLAVGVALSIALARGWWQAGGGG